MVCHVLLLHSEAYQLKDRNWLKTGVQVEATHGAEFNRLFARSGLISDVVNQEARQAHPGGTM